MQRILSVQTSNDPHTNTQDIEVIEQPWGLSTICGIPVTVQDGNVFIDNQLLGKEIPDDCLTH